MPYMARYTKTNDGYRGQLVDWPEVVTEGATIEQCRKLMRRALREMMLANQEVVKEVPVSGDLFESITIAD